MHEIKQARELRQQEQKIAKKTKQAIEIMKKRLDVKRQYEEDYLEQLKNIKIEHDIRNKKYGEKLNRFSQEFQNDLMYLNQSK